MVVVAGFVVAAAGCTPAASGIDVDLRTDLSPGREFTSVRTIFTFSGSAAQVYDLTVHDDTPALDGVRVAETSTLGRGDVSIAVSLVRSDGSVLLRRTVVAHPAGGFLVVVVPIHRSCEGVVCPDPAGDPTRTECHGGRCVDPRCDGSDPTYCGTASCRRDADCAIAGSCGEGRCVTGACLVAPSDASCAIGQTCDPTLTCVAGTPRDAGPADAGPADAGSGDAASTGCTPGDTSSMGCGNCGHAMRTCQADHTWGSYGACMGEGCHPGDTNTSSCSEGCNTYTQTCQSDCTWGPYGACTGGDQCPCTTCRYCIDDQTYDQCHLGAGGCLEWEGSAYTCLSFPGTHCSGGFCVGP